MNIKNFFRRWRLDRDMEDEMRFHVDMEAKDLEARGIAPDEARRQALASFGGVTRYKEEGQEARGTRALEELQRDLRYSVRSLLRSPGYSAVVIGTLALGIAANTSIFSVANGVLFKPLPWHSPDKLLIVGDSLPFWGVGEAMVTGTEITRLRRETQRFSGFAALRRNSVNIGASGGAEPLQVPQAAVSANLFQLLGAGPQIGRGFAPGEDQPGAPRVAVISNRLWLQRFGGDSGIVGTSVLIDGNATTVLGVLPGGFHFTSQGNDPDVFMPLVDTLDRMGNSHMFMLLARVRDDASMRDGLAEMEALGIKIDAELYGKRGFRFKPVSVQELMVRKVRPALVVLLGAVGSLLLIMCANLAVLALVRAARREREITVRRAIGASAGRVTRQIFTETVVLSLAGAALGTLLGTWALQGLLAIAPQALPRRGDIAIDWVVLAVTLGAATLVGVGMGLAPAFHSLRSDIASVLREKAPSHSGSRVRRALVIAQVAISLVLLASSGLLLGSFVRLASIDPGFEPRHVLRLDLLTSRSKYSSGTPVVGAMARFNDALRALPGVTSVGAAMSAPVSGGANQSGAYFPASPMNTGEQSKDQVLVDNSAATADWFRAAGVRILEGAEFDARHMDSVAARVAIIDDVLAKRFFPSGNVVGQALVLDGDTLRVWGVSRHVRLNNIQDEGMPQVWVPHRYAEYRFMSILIRTEGDPIDIAAAARHAIRGVDADQPITRIAALTDAVRESLAERRLVLSLVAAFAVAALLLAALGVYGVTSSAVTSRTRELGIRVALGATPSSVVASVLAEPARLLTIGLIVGMVGVAAGARVIERVLFGVSATDTGTMIAVALVLLGVGLVASLLPALRATRVEPVAALRSD
jgi:predicted permease